MNGSRFLDIVTERRMVPPHLAAQLRAQVAAATRPVTAAAVARCFVDAGHLTAYQARLIIGGDDLPARPAAHLTSSLELPKSETEELTLAPAEDLPQTTRAEDDSAPRAEAMPSMLAELRLSALEDPLEGLLRGQVVLAHQGAPLKSAPKSLLAAVPRWLIVMMVAAIAVVLALMALIIVRQF